MGTPRIKQPYNAMRKERDAYRALVGAIGRALGLCDKFTAAEVLAAARAVATKSDGKGGAA